MYVCTYVYVCMYVAYVCGPTYTGFRKQMKLLEEMVKWTATQIWIELM
jgi:hypothetical protein